MDHGGFRRRVEQVPLKDPLFFFSSIMIGWKIGYCVFFL